MAAWGPRCTHPKDKVEVRAKAGARAPRKAKVLRKVEVGVQQMTLAKVWAKAKEWWAKAKEKEKVEAEAMAKALGLKRSEFIGGLSCITYYIHV